MLLYCGVENVIHLKNKIIVIINTHISLLDIEFTHYKGKRKYYLDHFFQDYIYIKMKI